MALNFNFRLGDVLISEKFITQAQLDQAVKEQQKDKTKRLGAILISMGYITERQLLISLSKRLDIRLIDFDKTPVDIKAVLLIPKMICLKYTAIAVSRSESGVVVAINDPMDFYAMEDIKSVVNMHCEFVLALKKQILTQVDEKYSEIESKNAAKVANETVRNPISSSIERIDTSMADSDQPIVNLINTMLLKGRATNTSDIHIEPNDSATVIRMRIDGLLVQYLTVSIALHQSIIARIKIMGNLDIAEKRSPQDGHFRVNIDGQDLNVRVSILPTVYGEKAVLRFMSIAAEMDYPSSYGMNERNYRKISKILKNPYGIIYISGPTGSGKTTTLYMILEQISKLPINISTIEDPVERNLEGINQTQVNNIAGLSFETGLRSLLRQDPDVIMVGETRDAETAKISVSAAITGHLVFSTLHTNDAISSIVRLLDMGIEEYLVANSLVGVVAQRLIKKICPFCKIQYEPSDTERDFVGDITILHKGKGCHNCNNTGYKGRIAIHEVLEIDGEIRRMISKKIPVDNIYDYVAANNKLEFLKGSAMDLAVNGVTSFEELLKISTFVR